MKKQKNWIHKIQPKMRIQSVPTHLHVDIKWSFLVHKTFLELRNKTALQHPPKQLKSAGKNRKNLNKNGSIQLNLHILILLKAQNPKLIWKDIIYTLKIRCELLTYRLQWRFYLLKNNQKDFPSAP